MKNSKYPGVLIVRLYQREAFELANIARARNCTVSELVRSLIDTMLNAVKR